MSKVQTFEKLFRQADEAAGVGHCKSFATDDGTFTFTYDEESLKRIQKADQLDIETMRSMSNQVVLPTDYDSVLVGLYKDSHLKKEDKTKPLPAILGNWEDEVEELYGYKSSSSTEMTQGVFTTNNKVLQKPTILQSQVGKKIPVSFSRFFDGDVLSDVEDAEDPFDTIIPNPDESLSQIEQDEEFNKLLNFGLSSLTTATAVQQNHNNEKNKISSQAFPDRIQTAASAMPSVTSTSSLLPLATRKKLFTRFKSAFSASDDPANASSSSNNGNIMVDEDTVVPVISANEAKAILAQKPLPENASASERRQFKLQQKIAEANLSRHELIALKRKQKADRLRGINPYFDPTLSLQDSRQNRSHATAGSATFREYHSGLVGSLTHAAIASQHLNSKPDLTEAELKHFHRPRMTRRDLTKPWHIHISAHLHASNNKSTSSPRHAKKPFNRTRTTQRAPHLALVPHKDIAAADTAQSTFILVEYSEEYPPVMQNYGMASLLVNFYRPSKGQQQANAGIDTDGNNNSNEDDENEEASALQRMSNLLAKHKLRLPHHVSQLWRLQHNKEQYTRYDHDADIPRLELGQTKLLNPEDETPLLGWDETDTLQPALVNRLFRAPLFPQQVKPTDFLLVRSRVTKDGFEYVLREIPFIFCAGQVEPLRLVPRPAVPSPQFTGHFSPTILPTQRLHYALAIARILKTQAEVGVSLVDLEKSVLKYSYHAPHRAAHRDLVVDLATRVLGEYRQTEQGEIRLFLREEILVQPPDSASASATSQDMSLNQSTSGGNPLTSLTKRVEEVLQHYFPSHGCYDPQQLHHFHPDRLSTAFDPEDSQTQTSSAAAEYRMRSLHLLPVDPGFLQHYLHFAARMKSQFRALIQQLGQRRFTSLMNMDENDDVPKPMACQRILQKLLRRVELLYDVARYMLDRLCSMPWSSTEAFVSCVLDKQLHTSALFYEPPHANSNLHGDGGAAATASGGQETSALLLLQALHGLNAPYCAMPVGNIMHFPYHSLHPALPKILDVQGVADPSGLGQAFALKRYIHVNSRDIVAQLWPQLRDLLAQNNTIGTSTSSNTAATKKEDKGLYNTDKDMRRLTKAEAIVILMAFGYDRAAATALPRWDRIHVIREYVQQAEKEGRSSAAWQKYLRDDRASSGGGFGLRRARTRMNEHAYGRYASKEHFQGVCREIWRRQAQALSSDDWQRQVIKQLSLTQEVQSRLRRKQRRELLLLEDNVNTNKDANSEINRDDKIEDDDDDEVLVYERQQKQLLEQQQLTHTSLCDKEDTTAPVIDPRDAERARKREIRRLKRLEKRRLKLIQEGRLPDEEEDTHADEDKRDEDSTNKNNTNNSNTISGQKRSTDDASNVASVKDHTAGKEGGMGEEDDDDDDMLQMLKQRAVKSDQPSQDTNGDASSGGNAAKRARFDNNNNSSSSSGGEHSRPSHGTDMAAQIQLQVECMEKQQREQNLQLLSQMARPQKVVRRIQRTYTADGRVTVIVSFSFDTTDVLRCEQLQATQQQLKIDRRLDARKMEAHVWRRLRVLQQAAPPSASSTSTSAVALLADTSSNSVNSHSVYVPGQGLVAQVYAVDDYAEEQQLLHGVAGVGGLVTGTVGGALSINLQRGRGHMFDEDGVGGSGGGGRRRSNAQGSGKGGMHASGGQNHADDGFYDVPVGEEEIARLHQNMQTSSRRHKSVAEQLRHTRLPHVALAAMLETEVMSLWNTINAEPFKWPVDTSIYPTYAALVPNPICLSDIRQKVVSYQYSSTRELLIDVERMVRNAEKFNGESHAVSKCGRKLLSTLKNNLEHYQRIFGEHQDAFSVLEVQVAKLRAAQEAKQLAAQG